MDDAQDSNAKRPVTAKKSRSKELDQKILKINRLPEKMASGELDHRQLKLDLGVQVQTERDGIQMGVLTDGTPFLTGRGLARLLDMENLHVRSIGMDWNETPEKPRIAAIKAILASRSLTIERPYIEVFDGVRLIHAFPDVVCSAVLEYYAFDAEKPREAARKNFRVLAGRALRDFIYSQVGYDPSGLNSKKFDKWHERIALNWQAAPRGYFHVFNEAHTIIYELIMAGANIGDNFVVDISIGRHWSDYWTEHDLVKLFGECIRYQHCYPDSFAQSKANPHDSWCYPVSGLGCYREWLQDIYIEGGKFKAYLASKAKKGDLPPSVANLALAALAPKQLSKAS